MPRRLQCANIGGIRVGYWNPRRPLSNGSFGARLALKSRPFNFGDLLGPLIVEQIASNRGLRSGNGDRLLSVGSIMHFARPKDTIWGTGVNGKVDVGQLAAPIRVKAVRGPLTRKVLLDSGVDVPAVFGDPALLLPELFPALKVGESRNRLSFAILPNLHDLARVLEMKRTGQLDARAVVLNPASPARTVVKSIADCQLLLTSSLHGQIVAEAFGVPVAFAIPSVENRFKYADHLLATGRSESQPVCGFEARLEEARELQLPPLNWDAGPLVRAFPQEMWKAIDKE